MSETRRIAPSGQMLQLRGLTFSPDWITRPLFGSLLAALVVAATFLGTPYLAILVALSVAFAAREWHRMVTAGPYVQNMIVSFAAIGCALAAIVLWPHGPLAWTILILGAALAFVAALSQRANPVWQCAAVIYLGVPALALIATRAIAQDGAWLMIGLFLIVWATDTGALIAGNLIGGVKLAPALSPNKTWSGTLGGIAAAAIVETVYVLFLHGDALRGLLFGAGLAVVAHAGDLFESWVKRRFSIKDSGSLIPGHGGALDRIDSTLSAAVALAVLVLVLGWDPLHGAHP